MKNKNIQKLFIASCALLSSACITFSLCASASDETPDPDTIVEIIVEEPTVEESTPVASENDILPQSDRNGKEGN